MPPTWLVSEFAELAHGAAVADTIRNMPDPAMRSAISIGVQATGAIVTIRSTRTACPLMAASLQHARDCAQDQGRQGRCPRVSCSTARTAIDGLIFTDCMGAYREHRGDVLDSVQRDGGRQLRYNGTLDLTVAGNNIPDAVIIGGTAVRTRRKSPPTVVFMSENMWGNAMLEKDTQGRPLVVSGWAGPANARGIGDAIVYGHVAGQLAGLPVVPSWAGQDVMYVVKSDDVLLLESSTFNFRYEEVLGPESIRLGVWGDAAVVTDRYPKAWAKIRLRPAAALPLTFEAEGDDDTKSESKSARK